MAEHLLIESFAPVSLDELDELAALQTRVDRKYVLSPNQLDLLLDRISGVARVLEIDRRRTFSYESVYFDTPDRILHRHAAWKRPNRFKVRTRTYVDTGTCNLEVKRQSRTGHNVKHRTMHALRQADILDDEALAFLRRCAAGGAVPANLSPALTTRYQRSTLLIGRDQRITIDRTVTGTDPSGHFASFGEFGIIETKATGRHGPVDLALWAMHERPVAISKYCTSLAAICPELPANRWHRSIQRYIRI